ncbi:MAG: hypothetical protein U0575_01670 [Phycisphaerales bacterium]
MTEEQAFRHVVLPQSFRIILPPLLNDLVSAIKDTSLVYVVGVRGSPPSRLGISKSASWCARMLVLAAALLPRRLGRRRHRRAAARASLRRRGAANDARERGGSR